MTSLFPVTSDNHSPAFQRNLIVGIAALNLLFFVLAGLFLRDSRQHYEATALIRLEDLALEVERDIANTFDQVDLVLHGLSDHYTDLSRSGRLDEPAWEAALASAQKRLPMLLVLRATDTAGLVRHGLGDVPGERLDVSGYPEFQHLRDNPGAGLQISRPVLGKSSRFKNIYGMVLSRRLTDVRGRFAGTLRAAIALDYFALRFAPLRLGEQGFISLRDDKMRLILRQPPLTGEMGAVGATRVSDDFRAALAAYPAGGHYTSGATSIDGVPRLHAYRRNDMHRFYINMGMPLEDIRRPWWREVRSALGMAAFFAAMSSLLGFWLTGAWRRQQAAIILAGERQQELSRQKTLLRDVLDTATVAIFTIDGQGVITHANPCMAGMFGYSLDDIIGSNYFEHVAPEECDTARERLQAFLDSGSDVADFERRYWRQDGKRFLGHLTGKRYREKASQDVSVVCVIMDIEERRHAEIALRQSEESFRALIEHAPFGINLIGSDGKLVYLNPAFQRLLGYTLADLPSVEAWWPLAYPDPEYRETVMREWQAALAGLLAEPPEVVEQTFRVRCANGEDKIIEFVAVPLPDRQTAVTIRDVTLDKLNEQNLERIAHYDSLTGLPNRLLLADRLAQDMAKIRRSGKLLAVCYIDLDGFKPVNDTYGHEAGDRLLVEIARRLKACVRESDTVARVGGDEFVLLLMADDELGECEMILTRTLEAVAQPFAIDGAQVCVSASLGFTLFPQDHSNAAVLLEHADQAMYEAKAAGKNRFARFAAINA